MFMNLFQQHLGGGLFQVVYMKYFLENHRCIWKKQEVLWIGS